MNKKDIAKKMNSNSFLQKYKKTMDNKKTVRNLNRELGHNEGEHMMLGKNQHNRA